MVFLVPPLSPLNTAMTPGTIIDHPFIADLKASSDVSRADVFHEVCLFDERHISFLPKCQIFLKVTISSQRFSVGIFCFHSLGCFLCATQNLKRPQDTRRDQNIREAGRIFKSLQVKSATCAFTMAHTWDQKLLDSQKFLLVLSKNY